MDATRDTVEDLFDATRDTSDLVDNDDNESGTALSR